MVSAEVVWGWSSNHSRKSHPPPANDFACDHAIKSQQITTFGRWERQSQCKSQFFPGKVTTWAPQITKEITAPGRWESRLCLAHLRLCPGLEPSLIPAICHLVLVVASVMTSRACMRCLRRGNVVSCTSFFSLFSSGWMKFVQLENKWLNGIILLDQNYVPQIKKLRTYSSNVVSYIAFFHLLRLEGICAAWERMIGWYHTGLKLRTSDQEISNLFKQFVPWPVMVIVDDHWSRRSGRKQC